MSTKRATYPATLLKASSDYREGRALVAVFGNVDKVGDKVLPGAFKEDIARWKASGDPIPFLWSHDWADPFAHIGIVTEATETEDGLVVDYRLDQDTPFSRQVGKLLAERRVKEFSFAYDILEDRPGDDGSFELVKLHIIEVGSTLKGINPETQLLEQKALTAALDRTKAGLRVPGASAAPTDDLIAEVHELLDRAPEPESLEEKYPLAAQELAKAKAREEAEAARRARFAKLALEQTVVAGQEPLSTEEIAAANVREAAEAKARLEQNEAERAAELRRLEAVEGDREADLEARRLPGGGLLG